MRGECIIDMYAHVYRTAEIGRQAMQGCARPQRWEGVIDELRASMRDTGIWRAVIATITPTQTMREKALALLPPDLSHQSRQKAEAEVREGIEQASDAVKTLAEAKSPAEFFQIQSELARASFDRFVAEPHLSRVPAVHQPRPSLNGCGHDPAKSS